LPRLLAVNFQFVNNNTNNNNNSNNNNNNNIYFAANSCSISQGTRITQSMLSRIHCIDARIGAYQKASKKHAVSRI